MGENKMGYINKNAYHTLFKDEKGSELSYNPRNHILETIEISTLKPGWERLKLQLKYKVDLSKVRFNRHTGKYEYKDKDEFYTFDKISKYVSNNITQEQLETTNRYGKCHEKSISMLRSERITNASIVTGYISTGRKYLHSVLEKYVDGELCIVDYTKNLIMPKEQYIKLTKFQEIQRETDEEFLEDSKRIGSIVSLGAYVAFRQEIMNEVKRKENIFEEDPEITKEVEKIKKAKAKKRDSEER